MKNFTKCLQILFVLLLFKESTTAATLKVRDMEGREIMVSINGKKFPDVGRVITINNLPSGIAFIKVYSVKKSKYGNGVNQLIYNGKIKLESQNIYRATVDDYEGMDVKVYCCVTNNGGFNGYGNNGYNNGNNWDYNDHDWDNNYWHGNHHGGGHVGNGWNNNGNGNGWNNNGNGNGWGNNGFNQNVMSDNVFNNFINALRETNFDSGKLALVKSQLQNNFITAAQLREVVSLFSFESTKLDAAKFGAKSVVDGQNLVVIYNAFDFESTKTQFANFIAANNLNTNMGNNNGFGGSGANNNNGWGNNGWGNDNYNWNNNNGNNNNTQNGAMGAKPFKAFLQILNSTSNENTRMQIFKAQVAKQAITSAQLNELVSAFNYESNKLESAKFGAQYVLDKNNLFTILGAFSYASTKNTFAKFIKTL